jgi:hypothetical protein
MYSKLYSVVKPMYCVIIALSWRLWNGAKISSAKTFVISYISTRNRDQCHLLTLGEYLGEPKKSEALSSVQCMSLWVLLPYLVLIQTPDLAIMAHTRIGTPLAVNDCFENLINLYCNLIVSASYLFHSCLNQKNDQNRKKQMLLDPGRKGRTLSNATHLVEYDQQKKSRSIRFDNCGFENPRDESPTIWR